MVFHFILHGLPAGSSAGKRIHLQCRRPQFDSWVRKISWRRDRLSTSVFLGFPGSSARKESACNEGDLGSIPGLEDPLKKGTGYLLQNTGLKNSIDCIVHGVAKSWTRLSDWTNWFLSCRSQASDQRSACLSPRLRFSQGLCLILWS